MKDILKSRDTALCRLLPFFLSFFLEKKKKETALMLLSDCGNVNLSFVPRKNVSTGAAVLVLNLCARYPCHSIPRESTYGVH